MLHNHRYSRALIAVLYVVSVSTIFAYINSSTINWPREDDFNSIDWYNNIVHNRLFRPSYLWYLGSGHHPILSQALVSTTLFAIAGINFKILITLNLVFALLSAMMLSYLVFKNLGDQMPSVIALFGLLLIFFHPVQISNLLWAYELGWFLINLILVSNAVIIESSFRYRVALSFVLCLVGAESSAQGGALWSAIALHLSLLGTKRNKYMILVFAGLFAVNATYLLAISPGDVQKLEVYNFAIYFLQLLGSIFCQREHNTILLQGIVVGLLTVIFLAHSFRARSNRPIQRVALILITTSLVFLLQFASARFRNGIDWALSEFHAGSLLIPLLAGFIISSVDWMSSLGRTTLASKLAVLAPCLYILASVFYSAPFAIDFSKESKLKRELARHFACQENAPPYVVYGLNWNMQMKDLCRRLIPLMADHCKVPDSEEVKQMLRYPPDFTNLAAQRPEARDALDALWQVYLVNFDLSRAFPPTDPRRGEELLRFAINSAHTGSQYAPEMLKPYEGVFISFDRHEGVR